MNNTQLKYVEGTKLYRFSDLLDIEYGKLGTPERERFEQRAIANYYAEMLKEERKKEGLTQAQLAERVGKKREYIANIERGKTDMQLSTFYLLSNALGLQLQLVRY
jgi:ribosome-binding protein aMBF1 (putative translation factor)